MRRPFALLAPLAALALALPLVAPALALVPPVGPDDLPDGGDEFPPEDVRDLVPSEMPDDPTELLPPVPEPIRDLFGPVEGGYAAGPALVVLYPVLGEDEEFELPPLGPMAPGAAMLFDSGIKTRPSWEVHWNGLLWECDGRFPSAGGTVTFVPTEQVIATSRPCSFTPGFLGVEVLLRMDGVRMLNGEWNFEAVVFAGPMVA